MESSDDRNLNSLLAASRNGDAASVASVWRELTPAEQESVVFSLLAVQASSQALEPEQHPEVPSGDVEETAAMAAVEETELIPKVVEDLQGLTGSQGDDEPVFSEPPALLPDASPGYWSRWLRRWKISVVVAAWAVTTVFAFTADTSTFGPREWFVAMVGTVVLGGVLVGTLVNFAVAAISTRTPQSTENN